MARIRNIKPGYFLNEDIAALSLYARVAFPGVWCQADREGRLEDRPKRLKVEILPYDNVDMDAILQELANAGFIQRYQVDGSRYIQVLKFKKHQAPHLKEAASTIPAPCSSGAGPETPEGGTMPAVQIQIHDPDHDQIQEGEGIAHAREDALAPLGEPVEASLEEEQPVDRDGAAAWLPSPGSAAPLPKAGAHPFSDDQVARLRAAIPADMGRLQPQDLPARIRHELAELVNFNDLAPEVQSAWRDLDNDEKAAWAAWGLKQATDAGKAPVERLRHAARRVGKALLAGASTPEVADVRQPVDSKVTHLRAAGSGRPQSNQQRTMDVLREAQARRAAGGGQ